MSKSNSLIRSEGFFQFLQRAGAGVGDATVSKLPKPRITHARRASDSTTPSARGLGSRLKISNRPRIHSSPSLAKDCEDVKQRIENVVADNAAVQDARAVLRQNLKVLIDQHYRGSQNALAKASGVAQTTIGNYLRKTYTGEPQLGNIALLARALGLQEAYMLLVPGLILGKRGPMTEGEIEAEVQKRLEARWDAVAREVEGLRVAHEEEATGRAPDDAPASGPSPPDKPRRRKP